jgi:hypothetical protein
VCFEDGPNGTVAYAGGAPEIMACGPGRQAAFYAFAERHGGWMGVDLAPWPDAPPANRLIPPLSPEIVPLGALGIQFEAFGASSPYDALLDQLAGAPADWALRLGESGNALRAALHARGKRKGMALLFGERNGALYVRINHRPKRCGKRPETNADAVMRALRRGPASLADIARTTDRSSAACGRALDRLRVRGRIDSDGDKFVLREEAK